MARLHCELCCVSLVKWLGVHSMPSLKFRLLSLHPILRRRSISKMRKRQRVSSNPEIVSYANIVKLLEIELILDHLLVDVNDLKQKRGKETTGKPRWSEHSKVHKEDDNRKLASLPPRVVKPGEFPAELFSSPVTVHVPVPAEVWKGTGEEPGKGTKLESTECHERDTGCLPVLFNYNSKPRSPHFSKVHDSSASPKFGERRKHIGLATGPSSKPKLRMKIGVRVNRAHVDGVECGQRFLSVSDEEKHATRPRSRMKSKRGVRMEVHSSSSSDISSEHDKEIRWVEVKRKGVETATRPPERLVVDSCASPKADHEEQVVLRHARLKPTPMGKVTHSNTLQAKKYVQSPASNSPKVTDNEAHLALRRPRVRLKQGKKEVSSYSQVNKMLKSSLLVPIRKLPAESNENIEKLISSKRMGKEGSSKLRQKLDLGALASPKVQAESKKKTEWKISCKEASRKSESLPIVPRGKNKKTGNQMKSSKRINNNEEILKEIERLQAILRSPRPPLFPQAVPARSCTGIRESTENDVGQEAASKLKELEMNCIGQDPADQTGRENFHMSPGDVWNTTKSNPSAKQKPKQCFEITCFQQWKNFVTDRKNRAVETMKSVFSAQLDAGTEPVGVRLLSAGLPPKTSIGNFRYCELQKEEESPKASGSPPTGPFWPFREGDQDFDGKPNPQRFVNLDPPSQSQRPLDQAVDAKSNPQRLINFDPPNHSKRPLCAPNNAPLQETIASAFACTSPPVQLPLLCCEGKVDGSFSISTPVQSVQSERPIPETKRAVWNGIFSCDDTEKIQPEVPHLLTSSISNYSNTQSDADVKEGQPLLNSEEIFSPGIYGTCALVNPSVKTTGDAAQEENAAASVENASGQHKYLLTSTAIPNISTAVLKTQKSMDARPGRPRWSSTRVDGGSTTIMTDSLKALRNENSMKECTKDSNSKKESSIGLGRKVFVLDSEHEEVDLIATKKLDREEVLVAKQNLPSSGFLSDTECPRQAQSDIGRKAKSSIASFNNVKQERTGTPRCKNPTSAKKKTLAKASTAEIGTNVVFSSAEEGPPSLSEKGVIVRMEVRVPTPEKGRPAPPEKGVPRWRP